MSSRRESDFARLRRIRQEAEEQAEQERRRAEDERRNRREEEKRTRPTTFEEYLRACHTLLSKPLRLQTDKSLSTQGSITSPKNKPCPTLLKPWTNFPTLQQQLFEKVSEYLPQDAELFSSIQFDCGNERGSYKDAELPGRASNPETSNVVLVDFERSEILKQVSVLQETSPNRKRKHLHIDPEASCRVLPDLSSMAASASIGVIHISSKVS